jgi:hypothetical protein
MMPTRPLPRVLSEAAVASPSMRVRLTETALNCIGDSAALKFLSPSRGEEPGRLAPCRFQELSTSRGTAPLSFRALPRPESDGFVMK